MKKQFDLNSSFPKSKKSYAEALEEVLNASKVRGINRSLSNIERLCEIFNHPEKAYPTIHIAGTNGKGSVATKIAHVLESQGYVTGLYTSPHISTFRERIQVNGKFISEQELTHLFCEIPMNIPATFFEIATLLSFLYFQRKKVDIAVLETGLGGRLDATNVVHPLISVITSIGFDHMDILGSTLEEIAQEKAGIIKKGVPLVIGPDVSYSFMKKRSSYVHQSLLKDDDYDKENQGIAKLACEFLKPHFPISDAALKIGLKAKPPCRFERHFKEKEIILDVAHNSHGFNRLIQILKKTFPDHDFRFVLGFSQGKDIRECAKLIRPLAKNIHLVSGSHPRLASVQEIKGYFDDALSEENISRGVQNALNAFNLKNEVVVIAGSFFIMQEARKAIGLNDQEDPFLWYDPIKILK